MEGLVINGVLVKRFHFLFMFYVNLMPHFNLHPLIDGLYVFFE